MYARSHRHVVALCAVLSIAAAFSMPAAAGKRPSKPPAVQGAFTDLLDGFDSSRWAKSDGWANGSPFDNAWSAGNVNFHDGLLELVLDDTARLGQPYTSAEYRSTGYYGYGCYEASFRPVAVPGAVTAFFTFAGPYDNGGNGKHNEIDIEFVGAYLGEGPSSVQFNFWTNDDGYASRNEYLMQLEFDATAAFHAYGFKWTSAGIDWYVDGDLVYSVFDTTGNPTPKASDSLQKIMLNLWPVDDTASGWAGTFVYPGEPLRAQYQWVRYASGEDCEISAPPSEPPPPPPGDPATAHVLDIAMSLDPRATQAISRVSVVDGLGRPVVGAAVSGTWSGLISSGDGSRDTDGSGMATFYSSRTRSSGDVTFCVNGISLAGMTYDSGLNAETCATITK
jgi:endo-1,3-1,4-beta-glycanase ExoK